jgi:hypothetical protein
MQKTKSTWLASAALVAALLAGCGGGSSGIGGSSSIGSSGSTAGTGVGTDSTGSTGSTGNTGNTGSTDISQSISALYDYVVGLIAGTSDSSDPIDINALTLATDNSAEPTPLN